ncbi:MAG: serine/threonine-protein phosphatase [Eubacteriales bacterium]|nr:serine/threonine-protein phosphatase [Eubacteriales bacterium]
MEFEYGAVTDRGDIRTENQDSILCLADMVAGCPAGLFVVADGMGGLSYGNRISTYITEQFLRWWNMDLPQMLLAGRSSEEDLRELLEQEIWDINQAVLQFRKTEGCRSGSTLSVLLLLKDKYYLVHMGDSRIYRLRTGELEQLTVDQSLVAQLVREHRLTEEEARASRQKNILTMCVGMFDIPRNYYSSGLLQQGDCFLLCSDGLYNPLDQERLKHGLEQHAGDAKRQAGCLRAMIQPGQASDNVSAIVVEVR